MIINLMLIKLPYWSVYVGLKTVKDIWDLLKMKKWLNWIKKKRFYVIFVKRKFYSLLNNLLSVLNVSHFIIFLVYLWIKKIFLRIGFAWLVKMKTKKNKKRLYNSDSLLSLKEDSLFFYYLNKPRIYLSNSLT